MKDRVPPQVPEEASGGGLRAKVEVEGRGRQRLVAALALSLQGGERVRVLLREHLGECESLFPRLLQPTEGRRLGRSASDAPQARGLRGFTPGGRRRPGTLGGVSRIGKD